MKSRSRPPPAQRERFEQAARELGVDLDEEKLKETLRHMKEAPKHSPGASPGATVRKRARSGSPSQG